jgi:predicted AlkP superfamily phosphohydrolase/phosphomutase
MPVQPCGGLLIDRTLHSDECLATPERARQIVLEETGVKQDVLANGNGSQDSERTVSEGSGTFGETREQPLAREPRHRKGRRLFVIGLDCAPPELIFDRYRDDLPTLRWLMEQGVYGELESCTPPITVPAWSSMTSSRDPGQLGFYGFRNRADHSYDRMAIATSKAVKADRIWDILSRVGKNVIVVGVPQTYPVTPVNGHMISCFLTPTTQSQYTYPASLKAEIEKRIGEYMVDVPNFRTENKDWLLRKIYEMTEKRFRVVRYLMRKKPWDFFMFVEMGTDRIHHGFWKFMDPQHIRHEPGNRFVDAILEYYKYIDREIAELLDNLDDDTVVMVISDHGAKRMDGGIAINEWLMQNGYLTLKQPPAGVVPIEKVEIDWSRTKAWGAGGYYGRLFLNIRGREPQGVIEPSEVEAVKEQLISRLEAITDESGQPIGTKVYRPEKVYREINNVPPDLIIYFGDLYWRSVGSVGLGQIHTRENDTGPDDANHARRGIYICHDPRNPMGGQRLEGLELVDFAPTALEILGVGGAEGMIGKVIGEDG